MEYTQYYVSLTIFEFLRALTMGIAMFRPQTIFFNFFLMSQEVPLGETRRKDMIPSDILEII